MTTTAPTGSQYWQTVIQDYQKAKEAVVAQAERDQYVARVAVAAKALKQLLQAHDGEALKLLEFAKEIIDLFRNHNADIWISSKGIEVDSFVALSVLSDLPTLTEQVIDLASRKGEGGIGKSPEEVILLIRREIKGYRHSKQNEVFARLVTATSESLDKLLDANDDAALQLLTHFDTRISLFESGEMKIYISSAGIKSSEHDFEDLSGGFELLEEQAVILAAREGKGGVVSSLKEVVPYVQAKLDELATKLKEQSEAIRNPGRVAHHDHPMLPFKEQVA